MAKTSQELQEDGKKSAALSGQYNDQEFIPGTNQRNPNYTPPSNFNNSGGGSGGSCFPKGTKVWTTTGLVDISLIKEGDVVKTFDIKTNSFCNSRVLKKINAHRSKNLLEITLDDGTKVKTTTKHSFRINNKKWIRAKKIRPGNTVYLLRNDGFNKGAEVTSVKRLSEDMDVYNIISDSNFNFVVEGMLVHSFSYVRNLQSYWWNLKKSYNSSLTAKYSFGFPKNTLSNA